MGQHWANPTAQAAKRGELTRREQKPASFWERVWDQWWDREVVARRPEPPTEDHQCVRSIYRARRRRKAAATRQQQRIALLVLRQRMKTARKAA